MEEVEEEEEEEEEESIDGSGIEEWNDDGWEEDSSWEEDGDDW